MAVHKNALVVAVVSALFAGGLIALARAAVAAPTWSIQPTPNPTLSAATLRGVSCASAATCVAVGYDNDANGADHLVAEQWDGNKWRDANPPEPAGAAGSRLYGVSCPTTTLCLAVGYYGMPGTTRSSPASCCTQQPLAEWWDGTTWTITSLAAGIDGGSLNAVSCSSAAACTVVGEQGLDPATVSTLAERWNGASWSVQPTPNPAGADQAFLVGVSCPSDVVCLAVGTEHDHSSSLFHAMAAVFRAGSWHLVDVPEPTGASQSELLGVDCGAVRRCQAIGHGGEGGESLLAEAWNGSAFSIESVPLPAGLTTGHLSGVSCTSSTACRAVGGDDGGPVRPIAVALQNGVWSGESIAVPRGTTRSLLNAVSCASGAACTAVGQVQDFRYADGGTDGAGSGGLVERSSNGGTWKPQRAASVSPTLDAKLLAIDCRTPAHCSSVGEFFSPYGNQIQPLAERLGRTRWTLSYSPAPPTAYTAQYESVSCPADIACTAVGTYTFGSVFGAVSAAFVGTQQIGRSGWHIRARLGATELAGVSCVSIAFCMAVGYGIDGSGQPHPFIYRGAGGGWDGSPHPTWTGKLSAVSCISETACLAVGTDSSTGAAVATAWDGSQWQLTTQPPVASVAFSGVSCRTATDCVAVGTTGSHSHVLLASWTDGQWVRRSVSLPAGVRHANLLAINCSPANLTCMAVGQATTAAGTVPLAVAGSGTTWTGTLLPKPAGARSAVLDGVRCFYANTSCEAVGYSTDATGKHSTLAKFLH